MWCRWLVCWVVASGTWRKGLFALTGFPIAYKSLWNPAAPPPPHVTTRNRNAWHTQSLTYNKNRNFAVYFRWYSAPDVDTQNQTSQPRNTRMARHYTDKHNVKIHIGSYVPCAVRVLEEESFYKMYWAWVTGWGSIKSATEHTSRWRQSSKWGKPVCCCTNEETHDGNVACLQNHSSSTSKLKQDRQCT